MTTTANLTITDGNDSLIIHIQKAASTSTRVQWHYIISDQNGATISERDDLSTPQPGDADFALDALLSFMHADAESYRTHMGSTQPLDGYLFGEDAAAVFYQLSEETTAAAIEREESS